MVLSNDCQFPLWKLHPETSLLLIIFQLAAPARGHCLNGAASPGVLCIFQGGLKSVTQPPSWWVMLAKQLTSVPSLKTIPPPQSPISVNGTTICPRAQPKTSVILDSRFPPLPLVLHQQGVLTFKTKPARLLPSLQQHPQSPPTGTTGLSDSAPAPHFSTGSQSH